MPAWPISSPCAGWIGFRAYYAALARIAPPYFEADDAVAGNQGVRYSRWSFLFTMASMVIVVNSVLGEAAVALVPSMAIKAPRWSWRPSSAEPTKS